MVDLLLQSDPDWFTYWQNWQLFEAVFEPLIWRLGRPGAALLIGVPFTMALWQQAESVVPPAILLTLFMGLILAGAPAGAMLGGYILVVVAAAIAYRAIFGGGS